MRPPASRVLVVAAAVLEALVSRGADGRPAPATVRLEAAVVEPGTAPPDTLCHLAARIHNGGTAVASSFAFRVKLDQRELGVKAEKEADGTLVWTDAGPVEGLPQTASFTLEIKK